MSFEVTGEMRGVPIAKYSCDFLYGRTIMQEFKGLLLALFREPQLGTFAYVLLEKALQRPQGDAAVLRQHGRAPFGCPRPFRPVLYFLQFMAHRFF
jgi:hypothetical protein